MKVILTEKFPLSVLFHFNFPFFSIHLFKRLIQLEPFQFQWIYFGYIFQIPKFTLLCSGVVSGWSLSDQVIVFQLIFIIIWKVLLLDVSYFINRLKFLVFRVRQSSKVERIEIFKLIHANYYWKKSHIIYLKYYLNTQKMRKEYYCSSLNSLTMPYYPTIYDNHCPFVATSTLVSS